MGWAAWVTLAVLAGVVGVSVSDRVDPTFALGSGVGLLLLLKVLSPERALDGFANPAVLIIGLLFILVRAVESSGWLSWASGALFGNGGRRAGLRSLAWIAALSGFISNATVVAVLMPTVGEWARRRGITASRMMMPIGFAATLGGVLTLVGTSSNLVVNGLLLEHGDPGLGLFELAAVGLPLVVVGVAFMVVVGPRLLPDHADPLGELDANPREYMAWLRVTKDGPCDGARVGELRSLKDLFVAGVERGPGSLGPVEPSYRLTGGDVLVLVGRVEGIADLASRGGLEPVDGGVGFVHSQGSKFHLVEAVVSSSSPIVGRNIRDAGFRGRYDAVVLAVHRHGEHLPGKIGDIVVQAGDTLLIAAGVDFLLRWRYARDFYLVSTVGRFQATPGATDWIAPAVLLAVIAAVAAGLLSLLHAVVAGVLALLALRRLRPAEAWASLHIPTLVMIAASVGISHALTDSGLAAAVVRHGLGRIDGATPTVVIGAILLVTAALTEILDNPAAAALVFPVAVAAAAANSVGLHAAAVAVAVGASTSFMTPFGYHANIIVAGAGGYRFRDFIRFGTPLKLLCLVVAAILIPWIW